MGSNEKPLRGIPAIAAHLGSTERQTFHMASKGQIPAKKVGGRWYAYASALDAHLRSDGGKAA